MAGLGKKIFGAALQGVGNSMVQQAQQTRQDALLALQREWRDEDREAAADLTREGWGRADERQKKSFTHAETQAEAVRTHSTSERKARQDYASGEADKGRNLSGEPVAPTKEGGGRSKEGGGRLYKDEDGGWVNREEALAATRGRAADTRSKDFEEEADRSIKDNTGYLSGDGSDLGGSRDMYRANYIAVRRENPTAAPSEVHAEAKKRTAANGKSRGGGGGGMLRQASADEVKTPPAEAPDAQWSEEHGAWFAQRERPDGKMGWSRVDPDD